MYKDPILSLFGTKFFLKFKIKIAIVCEVVKILYWKLYLQATLTRIKLDVKST